MSVLALWHEVMSEWQPQIDSPMNAPMRRRHAMETLASFLHAAAGPAVTRKQAERACGFDIVLRLASGQIDTMHATNAFFAHPENARWFSAIDMPDTGHKGVELTPAALAMWNDARDAERENALENARKVLESDVESQGFIVRLLPQQENIPAMPRHLEGKAGRTDYLRTLVRDIEREPFQPVYRKRPFGALVTGWEARLQAYFWPAPKHGYRETCAAIQSLTGTSAQLIRKLSAGGGWTDAEQRQAVDLAHAVFAWGGVPQDPDTVTPSAVQAVYQAALDDDHAAQARMNSGWTKVAAFATAHLDNSDGGRPQVIWTAASRRPSSAG